MDSKKQKIMAKLVGVMMMFVLATYNFALAQEEVSPEPPAQEETVSETESTPEEEAVESEEEVEEEVEIVEEEIIIEEVPLEEKVVEETEEGVEAVSPQEAEQGQESAPSEILEDTSNPQEVVEEETKNEEQGATENENEIEIPIPAEETTSGSNENEEEVVEEEVSEEETIQEEPVLRMTVEELEPDPDYTFDLEGKTIATYSEETIYTVPSIDIDDDIGALEVSGSCGDPYYVVLIYKSANDYDQNPGSYIFNKAFDCKGGRYSYSISELPSTLESGRYYLLMGGQGDVGSWEPISALVPISINKEQ